MNSKRGEFTQLVIHPTVRADGGKYTLKLKNDRGEFASSATLTVLDRPTPPQGPLDVHDVYEDHCDLKWRPPKDDGGCEVEYYEVRYTFECYCRVGYFNRDLLGNQVEKMDAETGQWTPVCKAKDCKAKVDGLRKGQMYHFRVKAVNKEGVSDPLTTNEPITAKNPYGTATRLPQLHSKP